MSEHIMKERYVVQEDWSAIASRVAWNVGKEFLSSHEIVEIEGLMQCMDFIPGGRYLRNAGTRNHQINNCLLLRVQDSREGWSDLLRRVIMAITTGAGIGINYSAIRPKGSPIAGNSGTAQGPIPLIKSVDSVAGNIAFAGTRYGALLASLRWDHADVLDFIRCKTCDGEISSTNISVVLDPEFFEAYHDKEHEKHDWAYRVYWTAIHHMLAESEPGFLISDGPGKNDLTNA
jgi:ribonucleoside-diphosphate reductase alpha chain